MATKKYGQQRVDHGRLTSNTESSMQNMTVGGAKTFWLRGITAVGTSGPWAAVGSRICLTYTFYSQDTKGRTYGGSALVTYGGANIINQIDAFTLKDHQDGEWYHGYKQVSDFFVIDSDAGSYEIHFTVRCNTIISLASVLHYECDTIAEH